MKRNIDYREDLKYVPHHKTGIKILDVHQLENLFPNYDSLLQRIENHREKLQQMNKIRFEKDSQYNLMYDNIFSIFGKRGAGKTSAMFTLKKILEMRYSQDVVLPIVMPEMIPAECSMIGWILSLLEEIVDELDQKVKSRNRMDNTQFGECIYRQSDSLKRAYEKVKELGFSQFYQSDWNESFSVALINKERQTQNSFDFSKELGRFWELLKKTIQETSEEKNAKEPLIYIIFDDVDLLPEAVTTLLSTIIKYLSHPNIIVFVTADEELLYDVIENNMNEKLGRYKELQMYTDVSRSMLGSSYENITPEYHQIIRQKVRTARQIPRLYADKVLPPSSRYYLKTYESYDEKSMFIERVEEHIKNGQVVDVQITLQRFFANEIDRYIKTLGVSDVNFLISNNKFIKAYFAFWGNTSRQLVNEALILQEFITRLINIDLTYKNNMDNSEKYLKSLYECIYDFAYNTLTAIGSSEMSVEEIKALLEELIVCKNGNWSVYLNYSYLREQVEEASLDSNNLENKIQQIINLSILLYFLENILVIESNSKPKIGGNQRKKIHGRGILVDILDRITASGESLVCKNQAKDVNDFLLFYEKLFMAPETLMQFDLMQPRTVRNYLNKLLREDEGWTGLEKNYLSKYSRENPKWLRSIVKILYFSNEGIYEIDKSQILLRKLNDTNHAVRDFYFEESLKELKYDLVKSLITIPESYESCWKKIKRLSNINEKSIIDSAEGILNIIKDSTNLYGDFKEVEKKVIEWLKANKIKDDYLKSDIYRRVGQSEKGNAARALAYLTELENISNKLLNSYSKFDYYKIIDQKKFKDSLDKLLLYGIVFPKEKYTVAKIPVSDMNRILWDITNTKAKMDWEGKYGSTFLYHEGLRNSRTLGEIYEELCNSVSLAIEDKEDVKTAIKIIIDTQQFKVLQKFYLWAYLKSQKDNPGDMRIACNSIPYKELYNEIRKEIKNEEGNYLSQLLKRYIEEAIKQYVDKLMEG